MKRILTAICALAAVVCSMAQTDRSSAYETMQVRADRMFHYREWGSAVGFYTLMLEQRPSEVATYGHAIVASGMLADTLRQRSLTDQALQARVAIDSLFTSVERISFSLGQTSLYEDYLLHLRTAEPWLARNIDGYLLRYYCYRRDPQGMIVFSKLMLGPAPNHEPFLYSLAQGYLLDGQTQNAVDTYLKITQLNPQAYDALLYLANYYADQRQPDQALVYFRQAQQIQPTPFVAAAIKRMSNEQ